ncbi:fused MFS/spermidine synthase [candidate division FCPU426 bacterium]|nr:fused MFS/spermidine synthase [candidate division FCPU426 bacterium]
MAEKNDARSIPVWMLMTTIFITGNVIMMLEVVGTRVVGPFFGVGIYVWSALITVTLLALAAGYWLGGRWADALRRPEYLYLAILLAAAFTLLIPVWRNPFLTFASGFGVRSGVLVGSALLFGMPLFLLGMVSPYATKLFTDQFEKLGSRVGLLYAVSTLGSFIGTLTMGFYLIPTFRLSTILVALGLTLLFLPLLYFLLLRSRRWPLFMLVVALAALFTYFFPRAPERQSINARLKVIHKTTSFYGEIKVLEVGNKKHVLLVDGVTQSGDDFKTHTSMPPYVEDMSNAIARYHPQARTAVVLGLGGGNVIHSLLARGFTVEVVEIDKKIIKVATTYFGIDPDKVKIHLDDGRRFVRHCQNKYDVIVLNTFNGESAPSHMLTREFFQEAKRLLNDQGIATLNFVGYVQGPHSGGAAAVNATLHSAFGWCHTYFREPKYQFSNIVFVAGDSPVCPEPQNDATWDELRGLAVDLSGLQPARPCTDDYNPVDFLNRVVYRRWRQLVIDSLGPEILLN